MKKTLKYISLLTALLVGFTGCVKEQWGIGNETGEELPYPTEGKALVKFTVAVPGGYAGTKANLADTPIIENMQVVVFGSSGFLKESADIETFEKATTNGNKTLYTYQAQLSLSDSKNLKVHIIANLGDVKLPWKYDTEVMNTYAYTTNNQDAYWASFILPNGVTLKKEWDEETQSMVYVKDGDYYQVTDDVTDAFCGGAGHPGLPLVRNFAKISVQSTTPQFVLDNAKTLAIINKPDRGSVAPYNPDNGNFIFGYKDIKYDDMRADYPGYSPSGTQWVDTDPDSDSIVWGTGTGTGEDIVSSVYMYERPIPAAGEPTSYMIVHGTFYPFKQKYFDDGQPKEWKTTERATPGTYLDLGSGVSCYYKVDFKDNEGAYAIFRNFRYHIRIINVAKAGAETAGAAGSTGGTGDISQDQSVASLTDFSDGYGRIAVSHTGWTFVDGRAEFELKYKFIEDAAAGDDSANNALVSEGGPVTITIGAKTGPVNVISTTLDSSISGGTEVDAGDNGKIMVMGASTAKDAEGFRTIKFTVNTPDLHDITTQTIHISGKVNETSTLSRDIKYYLMPRQKMIVECIADEVNADYGEDYVEATAGEGINVRITIPKMLPESMFPLQFSLESDALSITPNTAKYPKDNLPVANGNSICDGKTSSKSFHYVRTLGYTEYLTLDETLDGMQFTCHFKTNKANSASTIYVDNQYFNKGNDSFYNYTMYNFRNLSFTNNSANANSDVDFTFYLDDNDTSRPRTVEVKLDGLLPQEDSGLTPVGDDNDIYSYTLNIGVKYAKLTLRTISEAAGYDKTYAVTLNAYDGAKAIYHEASHGNVAQRITIDPTSLTMHPGDKKTLTATVWPASTGTGSLSWTTSNSSVVTVDGNGKVTAVGAGTANITVSYDGSVSATCAVTVSGISLNKTATTLMIVNGVQATEQLSVATLPTAVNYTWTSSDNSVATVSNTGLVTAVSSGTATITVTADDGRSANCIVTVKRRYTNVTATFNPSAFATNTTATVDDRVSVNLESNFSYYSNTQLRGAREGYYNYMSFNQYSGAELEDFEITRIVFNCSGDNYVPETNYTTFYTDDSESSTVGSYTVKGSVGTWTGTASTPYMKTYNYWNGIRITSIVVTYSYTE
ncbi:MAG: Ig domain-containing protein [Bacteroidales bacterium]|nr:Ig domain-containing protein [Bacteroidales bacterium]